MILTSIPDDPLWAFHHRRGEIFYMHAIYYDYYQYLQIISDRIKDDYRDYDLGLKRVAELFKIKDKTQIKRRDSDLLLNVKRQGIISKSIQLDNESFILFMRILLDKVGLLVELLLNHPNKHSLHHSFSDHKKYFTTNRNYNPTYSSLLDDLYWYDQYFLLIRDKVVQHGKQKHSWLRPGVEPMHILMGENYGLLEGKNKSELERIVKKYSPQYHEDIKNIQDLPLSDISVLIHKILIGSTRMEAADLQTLQRIIQFTGAAVTAQPISEKLNAFLKAVASIFEIWASH